MNREKALRLAIEWVGHDLYESTKEKLDVVETAKNIVEVAMIFQRYLGA